MDPGLNWLDKFLQISLTHGMLGRIIHTLITTHRANYVYFNPKARIYSLSGLVRQEVLEKSIL